MPLPSNLDTLDTSQLCQALASSSGPETMALVRAIRRRGLPLPIPVFGVMGGSIGNDPQVTQAPFIGMVREEWTELLRQGRCFSLALQQAAVAAQNSFVQLRNPAGSTRTLLVRAALADNGAAAATSFSLRLENATLGAGNNLGTQLRPPLTSPTSVGLINVGSQVGLTGTLVTEEAGPVGTTIRFLTADEYVCELAVGWALEVFNTTINQFLRVTFQWAEVDSGYPA